MAKHYPVWVDIPSCIYKSKKSYGIKDTGEQNIFVGSSKSNSHKLGNILITKRISEIKGKECVVFKLSLDGIVLRTAVFKCKNRRATELISIEGLGLEKRDGDRIVLTEEEADHRFLRTFMKFKSIQEEYNYWLDANNYVIGPVE
jgi:hypothetical protein